MKKKLKWRCLSPAIRKTLLVMKLSLILFFAFSLQLSASVSLAQRVSVTVSEASLRNVLENLHKQTGTYFMYNESDLNETIFVKLDVQNVSLEEALNEICKQAAFEYEIIEDFVVFSKKVPVKVEGKAKQKKKTIKGTVTDEDGSTLPGVSVVVKGTTYGVSTDIYGNYKLLMPEMDGVLVFSFVGMIPQEVKYEGQTNLNVTLNVESKNLNEIVVTGYQTLSKERTSGSFGSMDKGILENKPVDSPSSLLLGQMAGVDVKGDKITIRGVSSFKNTKALVVVDGFPIEGGINSINPNNIENVTVLKDASAASIWGARSSNGVIVITTKKAKRSKKESMNIYFNSFTRFGTKIDLDYANPIADAKTQLEIESYFVKEYNKANPGSLETPTDLNWQNSSVMRTEGEYLEGMRTKGYLPNEIVDKRVDELKAIDYKDDVYKYLLRRPVYQQYNLAVRGNSKKHNYSLSLLFDDNKSDYVGTKSNNMSIDFSDRFQYNDKITLMASIYAKYNKQENSGASMSEIRGLAAYDRLVNPDGSYANNTSGINFGIRKHLNNFGFPYDWDYNLLQEARNRELTSSTLQNRVQFGVNIKIIKGLSFSSKIQYEKIKTESKNFYGEQTYYVRNKINLASRFENGIVSDVYYPKGGIITNNAYADKEGFNFRNQLSFKRILGEKHHINAIVGVEVIQNKSTGTTLPDVFGASQYMTDVATLPDMQTSLNYGIFSNNTSLSIRRVPRYSFNKTRYFSVYSNASYTYDERYTLTGSVRTDASNIVSNNPKYRYAPLWSVGANWNAANEDFIRNIDFIDRLNFRVSYGINANAATSSSNVTTINYYAGGLGNDYNIATSFNHGNPDLRWETTRSLNWGIDFAVLKSKLFGSLDVYNKKGEDLYYARTYPTTSGVSKLNVNYAGISNKGFEITLGTQLPISKNISVISKLNYSYNENKITDIEEDNVSVYSQRGSSQYVKGDAVRDLYVFKYSGFDENGVPQVIAQDGRMHPMNTSVPQQTNLEYPLLYNVGHTNAPHMMGWTNTINIHNLSITSIITGKFGHVFQNRSIPYSRANIIGNSNFNKDLVNYLDHKEAKDFPGVINSNTLSNLQQQRLYVPYLSSFVEDASFIRFNDLIVNYDMSRHLRKLKFLSRANIYCNISNLGTIWTANKWDMDPEYPIGTIKPQTTYTFGVKLNLK